MAIIKFENYNAARHPNAMSSVDNEQAKRQEQLGSLVPYTVCVVEVCGHTFVFHSVMQVDLCIDYYVQKPSNRPFAGDERKWEPQRWHEKFPLYLLEEAKRRMVVAALENALEIYKKYPEAHTGKLKPQLHVTIPGHRGTRAPIGWTLRPIKR